MTTIRKIRVHGESVSGPFEGTLEFDDGLNVVSAKNAYGKTTATLAIPWVLGLEPMFGLQDNDVSKFPAALRDAIAFESNEQVRVMASWASATFERDNKQVVLERPIIGGDARVVAVTYSGERHELYARKKTMVDATGGLQHFLYEWLEFEHAQLMTTQGREANVYLENLAPHFLIDQIEGWSDIQALQVRRYGLIEIGAASIEYLLGARQALQRRFEKQQLIARAGAHKAAARNIAEQVQNLLEEQGWSYELSVHGQPLDIARRWASVDLFDVISKNFNMSFSKERQQLKKKIEGLSRRLTQGPLDRQKATASSAASQEAVNLKTERHEARLRLRELRTELAEQKSVLITLTHRALAARDLLRLKRDGIGILPKLECPTCHQSVDPTVLSLTEQSADSVEMHMLALERERKLIERNIEATNKDLLHAAHNLREIEAKLSESQRALVVVTQAVGSQREGVAKVASELVSAERELERTNRLESKVEELKKRISAWVREVGGEPTDEDDGSQADLQQRLALLTKNLKAMLLALGHSEVSSANVREIRLDENYTPYLGKRRLRSLGLASDHPRLVAAFALSLAMASKTLGGPHPGFVVLDEPLQQNPDAKHRELMLHFLANEAKDLGIQVIVITSLTEGEVGALRAAGVNVQTPGGEHFLKQKLG